MGNIVNSNKSCENVSRSSSDSDEITLENARNNKDVKQGQNIPRQEQRKGSSSSEKEEQYFNQSKTTVNLKVEKELTQKQFDDFVHKINVDNNVTVFKFDAPINIKKKTTNTVSKDAFKARSISAMAHVIEKKYKNIKELKLHFPSQSESNQDIDMDPIYSICNMLTHLNKLESLSLNFFQWGYYNSNIKTECLTLLCSTIIKSASHLKSLKLDFGRWGCEKYGNLKIYTDDTISSFCEMIQSLTQIRSLDINLRSWGYENYKITNKSVIQIFKSVGTLKHLVDLKINLTKWGYLNNNISETSLQDLKGYFVNLQNLKYIYLNFDLWTHLHNYKFIKEALVQLPLLEQCHIDTTEEQNEVKKLYELINYRKRNYLMAYSILKSDQGSVYRREILWDALRICMQDKKQ